MNRALTLSLVLVACYDPPFDEGLVRCGGPSGTLCPESFTCNACGYCVQPGATACSIPIPTTIAADCSADVTAPLLAWIDSVPDGSTLAFAAGGCYRAEGTLEVRGRRDLVFNGNGSTLRASNPGDGHRAQWRFVDAAGIVVRDFTIDGGYATPGTHDAAAQWSHGVEVLGTTGVEIANVTIRDVAGDCVYLGQGLSAARARSSAVGVLDGGCAGTGRNGVTATAANDVRVERVGYDNIGLSVFNVQPNPLTGYGADGVTFNANTIGNYYLYAFVLIGDAPVQNVTVSSNHVVASSGARLAVLTSAAQRRSNIRIIDNHADAGYVEPDGAAITIERVDTVTITGNTIPLAGSNMVLVDVSESTAVTVSANTYTGGVAECAGCP